MTDSINARSFQRDSITKSSAADDSDAAFMAAKDLVFKQWVRDTLHNPSIQKIAGDKHLNRIKKISIDDDSLMLKISYRYHVIIQPHNPTKVPEHVKNVIWLLKEYGELPGQSFDLTFEYVTDYTPTPTDFRYGAYDYLEDIQTRIFNPKSNDTIIKDYGYNRGSLSDKTVRSSLPGSEEKTTNFIWNGRKLIKN